jgi:sugar lactone lactonase YvrE
MGPRGGLYLLDKSPPRIVRLNRRTGAQHVYATFPSGAVPNYAAWGPDRALYVTDYEGATVWRVPRGGGTPRPWLRGPALNGGPFGTTGIVLTADRRTFVIGQQSAAGLGAGNPSTGRLYTVTIQPDGSAGPVHLLWQSRPADGPDGFAIARSGHLYVACLPADQIVELGADGHELARFPSAPVAGLNGSSVPFDSPSSVRFRYRRLLIANQSYFTGSAAHQAILDVYAGEPGLPEYIPHRRRRHQHHG